MTPTARTLVYLRKLGCLAGVVEQTISIRRPTPRIFKRDLFEFIDIVAIEPGKPGVLAVQTTTTVHQADRLAKIRNTAASRLWLEAGNRIQVIGWAKKGPRGERKTWQPTVTDVAP